MDDYWARWSGKLQQITEPYVSLEREVAPRSLPGEDLIEYYRCLEKLMRPLHLLQENRESPGDRLIGACEALEERLEFLSKAHPWFSEDESTRGMMELLEILTTRGSVEGEALEEKIRTIERRIEELEMGPEL
ncbi:hypothetical protein [Candidatus Methanocrinis natronophilus]|uniref:Uncharacterized protein n=1 Tax=Candidatus Methanocrinis natronophilus TaxID=3033396 RepID=A0ABT5X6A7_9EURY|nr:hypothetical protein [Candidatus Methanocrinis natronophilus]MDF0590219.1 hypothetical protein [Candidatus Methanocrinis natronophilus]